MKGAQLVFRRQGDEQAGKKNQHDGCEDQDRGLPRRRLVFQQRKQASHARENHEGDGNIRGLRVGEETAEEFIERIEVFTCGRRAIENEFEPWKRGERETPEGVERGPWPQLKLRAIVDYIKWRSLVAQRDVNRRVDAGDHEERRDKIEPGACGRWT